MPTRFSSMNITTSQLEKKTKAIKFLFSTVFWILWVVFMWEPPWKLTSCSLQFQSLLVSVASFSKEKYFWIQACSFPCGNILYCDRCRKASSEGKSLLLPTTFTCTPNSLLPHLYKLGRWNLKVSDLSKVTKQPEYLVFYYPHRLFKTTSFWLEYISVPRLPGADEIGPSLPI